ncbi:golgin subfamily A member 6-like protein 6 [Macrobrachium rosenbergii]|uniref:golgin subfamily A member 6-like protein 6 n=1 Tax=Macrobrachium rosenbergii TaxID=79674 RepID=UPI0034D65158
MDKEDEMKKEHQVFDQKFGDALNNLRSKKKDLTNLFDSLIEKKDHQIEDLLAKEDGMKKACEHLEGKLREALGNNEDMERLLKKKDAEKTELEVYCKTQIENREHKIHELLAQEENMEGKIESLEEKLAEALCNIEKEKDRNLELTNIYDKRTEDLYVHIKDLLAKEGNLKEEKEHLEEGLQDALRKVEELEKLLTKEKDQNLQLTNMYERMVEDLYVHIRDLLGKEGKQKKEKQMLEEKLRDLLGKEEKLEKCNEFLEDRLAEARRCTNQMEKLLKEEQDSKLGMEMMWQQVIQEKDKELNIRAQKCEESDAQLRSKVRELESLLNQEKELVKSKEKEATDLRLGYQETIQVKDQEHERLRDQNDCLQEEVAQLKNRLVIATSNEEMMKSELNCAKQEASQFQMTERHHLQKLQELTKKCEELQEKCQTLEESKVKAERHAMECHRKQEEALRKQDKLLLTRLFHDIAQRNNRLQNIGMEEAGRDEENVRQDGRQANNQEYWCAQNEKKRLPESNGQLVPLTS